MHDSSANAFALGLSTLSAAERRALQVGNSFFDRNWVQAPASAAGRDGVGPTFNAQSCSSCHLHDGRGRPPRDQATPNGGCCCASASPIATALRSPCASMAASFKIARSAASPPRAASRSRTSRARALRRRLAVHAAGAALRDRRPRVRAAAGTRADQRAGGPRGLRRGSAGGDPGNDDRAPRRRPGPRPRRRRHLGAPQSRSRRELEGDRPDRGRRGKTSSGAHPRRRLAGDGARATSRTISRSAQVGAGDLRAAPTTRSLRPPHCRTGERHHPRAWLTLHARVLRSLYRARLRSRRAPRSRSARSSSPAARARSATPCARGGRRPRPTAAAAR